MELLVEYMARGFVIMLLISMPCVLVAALIGLVIGILQAVTQVQEQTIAAAPKILAVFLVIVIGGYGFISMLTNFTTEGMALAFNVVPKNDSYVLPPEYYKYTRPFQGEMSDTIHKKTNLKNAMNNTTRANFGKFGKEQFQYVSPPKTQGIRPNIVEQKKIMGQ